MKRELLGRLLRSHKTVFMRMFEYIEQKTTLDNLNRKFINNFFYLEVKIIFRLLMLIGIILSVFVFPFVWLLRLIILVVFVDFYTVNQFFERALEAHLQLSNKSIAIEELALWIT